MAVYGPNSGGVPFTGFSPTLGATSAALPAISGSVQFNGMTQVDGAISRLLRQNRQRVIRELLLTLIGAAAGDTALETRTQIKAKQAMNDPAMFGGIVELETVDLVNRATTAADITNLNAMISRTPVPTYVADVSGVGGGGKLGW